MKNKYPRYKAWCSNCDRQIVEGGKKCPICGIRNYTTKLKKPKHNLLIKELDKDQ